MTEPPLMWPSQRCWQKLYADSKLGLRWLLQVLEAEPSTPVEIVQAEGGFKDLAGRVSLH